MSIDDKPSIAFLRNVREPLLDLHRAILDQLRREHEAQFGAINAAAFLQTLINGSAHRWLSPLSSVIAVMDDVIDSPKATPEERRDAARAVIAMFSSEGRNATFDEHYLPLLQTSPDIAVANGRVAQIVDAAVRARVI